VTFIEYISWCAVEKPASTDCMHDILAVNSLLELGIIYTALTTPQDG